MAGKFNRAPLETQRARQLRRDMTGAEKKLWLQLRSKQVAGVSFRRQHPIGAFIVDFCAPSLKLVIELDGGQHALDSAKAKDDVRTARLGELGFSVLRFWNNDVIENIEGVVQEIARTVAQQKATPS